MKPFSRVLAAVDFSKPARRAFEYALALSRQHAAELVVVQAVPRSEGLNWHAPRRRALIAELRESAARAQVAFDAREQQGDPAEIILLHARALGPDIIVAGTHQRTGLDRLRTASVAERLVARAAAPVLLVPENGHAVGPFTHVAVAVDFDRSSERAIAQALSLARGPADRITLIHVVSGVGSDPLTEDYRLGLVEYQDQLMGDDRQTLMRDARTRLQLAMAAQPRTAAAVAARVLSGDVTTRICGLVGRIGADLLVVGVPARGAVARALFGTTAARLLRASPVPVLAVPEAPMVSVLETRDALPLAS